MTKFQYQLHSAAPARVERFVRQRISMLDSSVHCTQCGLGLQAGTCDNGCEPILEKITIGNFLNPLPSDASFRCLPDALERAKTESLLDDNDPRAVWIGAELHLLFFRGYELRCV